MLKFQVNTSFQFIAPMDMLNIREGDYLLQMGAKRIIRKGKTAVEDFLAKIQLGQLFSIDVIAKDNLPFGLSITNAKVINSKMQKM